LLFPIPTTLGHFKNKMPRTNDINILTDEWCEEVGKYENVE